MKKVLLIDGSPMFTEFLAEKFKAESIGLETAGGSRDAYTKIIMLLPDLIIIESQNGIDMTVQDLLDRKADDPNAYKIPVIITGPVIERNRVVNLAKYNVIKYFTKPVKFDIFFESVSKILKVNFFIDSTPCVLDIHRNNNIIFVEIARGLNREKLSILKFKLDEILSDQSIHNPKIVLMLSNISFSFYDVTNVERLLDNILSNKRINQRCVKVLSFDPFVHELLEGREEYFGIQIVENLQDVMGSLVDNQTSVSNINDVLNDKILTASSPIEDSDIGIKFHADSGETKNDEGTVVKVAIVDDDIVVRKLLQNTFAQISAETFLVETGRAFMEAVNAKQKFDVIILDIFIPDIDGFSILSNLQRQNYPAPVIVYSQATQKEYVIQSFTMGAKGFLVKPQKPSVILQKAVEVLNAR